MFKNNFRIIKLLPVALWILMWPSSALRATDEGQPGGDTTTSTTSVPEMLYQNGLMYETYQGSGESPMIPDSDSQLLSSGAVNEINFSWEGGEILDSGQYERVIVKFTGWIMAPIEQSYSLCGSSDDGFILYLDESLVINDWFDRGGGCGQTDDVDF